MSTMLEAALEYVNKGFAILPLWWVRDGKCACGKPTCRDDNCGKHPILSGVTATSPEQVRSYWERYPEANIGVRTGHPHGIIAIDIDPRHGGLETLEKNEKEYGSLPETLVHITGGEDRGLRYIFRYDASLKGNTLGAGFEVKADGQYIIVPPSNHRSGRTYTVRDDKPIAFAPKWLLERPRTTRVWADDEDILDGERNDFLCQEAGKLHAAGFSVNGIKVALYALNLQRCKPPETIDRVTTIARGAAENMPLRFRHTDIGNGKRLAAAYGRDLRFAYPRRVWFRYNKKKWELTDEELIYQQAKALTEEMLREAKRCGDKKYSEALEKFALRSQAVERMKAMTICSRSEIEIAAKAEDFDRHGHLLCCANGTVDLRSGELRPHDRKDLITRCTNVEYHPEARSERWDRFLQEAAGDCTEWLQRAFGYSLTGETNEEKFFFIYGKEMTGKDTILTAVTAAMGEYYDVIPPEAILEARKHGDAPSTSIAKLPGTRMVITSELPAGARLADNLTKAISGDVEISCHDKFEKSFKFFPKFKLWATMNFLPTTNFRDGGIWRRCYPIPFETQPAKKDPTLKPAFKTDPQLNQVVLAWLIRGAEKWYAGERLEISVPKAVGDARASYRASQNRLAEWLENELTLGPNEFSPTMPLLSSLEIWAKMNRVNLRDVGITSSTSFGAYLESCGFKRGEKGKAHGWYGLCPKTSNY